MKKIVLIAAAAAMLATPAFAVDWGFGIGGFALGLDGTGVSDSGAGNFSFSTNLGQSKAEAGTSSFGKSESAFGVGIGTLPATVDNHGNTVPGASAADAYGNFVGASVASGSMSTATTSSKNDGFSVAGTAGIGFANTTLTGAGLGAGGFATLP